MVNIIAPGSPAPCFLFIFFPLSEKEVNLLGCEIVPYGVKEFLIDNLDLKSCENNIDFSERTTRITNEPIFTIPRAGFPKFDQNQSKKDKLKVPNNLLILGNERMGREFSKILNGRNEKLRKEVYQYSRTSR